MTDKTQAVQTSESTAKPSLGISACLVGQKVRFDGGHKRSAFCLDMLSEHVKFQSFCPEVAIGLSVPRPTIRLIEHQSDDNKQLIALSQPDGSGDVTEKMTHYAEQVASSIDHLSGFVFTAKSPSCGMERVKVYQPNSNYNRNDGIGLFAQAVMQHNPNLPCEENGRLNDQQLRENFVLRIFAYHQWQQLEASGLTRHKLYQFQAKYKYLLMSHCGSGYAKLGKLLAQSEQPIELIAQQYIRLFMQALSQLATRKTHTNTLQHLQGYFSKMLNKRQKTELTAQIMAYRQGIVPLFAPLTLIKHYLNEFENQYLNLQVYFNPYPQSLKLRYSL